MASRRTNPGKTIHGSIHDSVQGAVGGMQTGQLDNFPALQDQSNATYDAEQRKLEDPANLADPNRAMEMINVGQSKMSPWAPWFQATANQGAGRFSQDTARPHGIADDPDWWASGDGGALAQLPIGGNSPSTNLATPNPMPTSGRLRSAIRGLKG